VCPAPEGERLGVLESRMREQRASPTDEGIALLEQVLANPRLRPRSWSWAARAGFLRSSPEQATALLRFVDAEQV